MTKLKNIAILFALFCATAQAQNVLVKDAWVRATVPGQQATGAFLKITSQDGGTLISASSPAAAVVQVHEMKMDNGVMRMRAVAGGLELPAGKTVELKPSGYHVMLMDLKAPLVIGAIVPLTLVVKNAKGIESQIELTVKVRSTAPMGMTEMDHAAHKAP
jgi:copper(I)-binding protein